MNDIVYDLEKKRSLYETFKIKCEQLIKEILIDNKIKYSQIESRVKESESLRKKVSEKSVTGENYEITDFLGIRIITYYEDTVDEVVTLLKNEFNVDEVNCVDKRIKGTDEFGYSSVHLVLELNETRTNLLEYKRFEKLKFEVQIRSLLQHAWAAVSHELKYKSQSSMPDEIYRKLIIQAVIIEQLDTNFKEIRQMSAEYSKNIEENVISEKFDEPINGLSLEQYLNSNQLVNQTVLKMAKELNGRANKTYPPVRIDQAVERLQFIKINTLHELDMLVQKYHKVLPEFFDKWLTSTNKKQLYTAYEGVVLDTIIFYIVLIYLVENIDTNDEVYKKFACNFVDTSPEKIDEFISNVKDIKELWNKK